MPRDAYLAHQQQIKWRMQRAGDLDADGNAATRQGKNQRMGLLQISELLRQLPSGIATVAEQMAIHDGRACVKRPSNQCVTRSTTWSKVPRSSNRCVAPGTC